MTKPDWEITFYDRKYLDGVLELIELVHGVRTSAAEFIWWFENNPLGELNVYLAINDGKVVGLICHSAFEVLHDGKEKRISIPSNATTHPDYRRLGIFSKLFLTSDARAFETGIPFMIGCPNKRSKPIVLNKLGWQGFSTSMLFFKPLKCENLARKVRFPSGAAGIFRLGNPIFARSYSLEPHGLSTERVFQFEGWADEIFEANKGILPICLVKKAEYLNWRFLQDPQHKYEAFVVKKGTATIGYFILGKTTKRDLSIGYVANALLLPEYRDHFFHIHESFVGEFKTMDVDFILYLPNRFCAPALSCLKRGYFPLGKRFFLIIKFNPEVEPSSHLRQFSNWFIQLGDLDFF